MTNIKIALDGLIDRVYDVQSEVDQFIQDVADRHSVTIDWDNQREFRISTVSVWRRKNKLSGKFSAVFLELNPVTEYKKVLTSLGAGILHWEPTNK